MRSHLWGLGLLAGLSLLVACSGDTSVECTGTDTLCGSSCVALDDDPRHCGACGTACDTGELCTAGACVPAATPGCPDGQTLCGSGCFDLSASPDHCGECAVACDPGELCSAGACQTSCVAGQTECDGLCVSTQTDAANCGACGEACDPGEACLAGACVASCGAGLLECGGACRDVRVDRANCGGCGVACGANEACEAGQCVLGCGPGQTECAPGECTSTATDENNCGGCGVACGAGELCVSGGCELSCTGSLSDECDGVCTNLQLDPANCGACDNSCDPGEVCFDGQCGSSCGSLTDCSGACTDIDNDPMNCGACGQACPAAVGAVGVCVQGQCATLCAQGQGDCDGDLSSSAGNGCETDLDNDALNCGACNLACEFTNATGACSSGACAIAMCDAGFDDCDTDPATGCEAELAADDLNCGACGNACGTGFLCSNGTCVDAGETGESCASPLELVAGVNTKNWTATTNDYLQTVPSCTASTYFSVGPDLVMHYRPTFNGFADFSMDKPTNNRFSMSLSDAACGTVLPEVACVSEYTAATMGFGIPVTANTDYYLYLVDTNSGTQTLPNPLVITVSEVDCSNPTPVTIAALSPTRGSTTTDLMASFAVTFSGAVRDAVGAVTITGSLGTTITYDLTTNPAQVSFDSTDTIMTVNPGVAFPPGEVLTLSWTGLVDELCGAAIAPPSPAYTVNVVVPPCVPGQNMQVGANVTTIPTGGPSFTEYYVSADTSTSGWVYAGGTTSLYRFRKDGSAVEDLEDPSRLGTLSNLGYASLYDNGALYVMDDSTSTTLPVQGRLTRLTTDDGATWGAQDMAIWSTTAPADDFRSMAVFGGRLYMLTHEGTSTVDNQVWSIDLSGPFPAEAVLEGSFGGGYACSGFTVDMNAFYAVCGNPTSGAVIEPLLRVDRTTLAVTVLQSGEDYSATANQLHGDDVDGDGVLDYLYVQGWYEAGAYVCDPAGTPYISPHFTFNTGANSNYGMGFDRVNKVLWLIDDGDRDLIRVQ